MKAKLLETIENRFELLKNELKITAEIYSYYLNKKQSKTLKKIIELPDDDFMYVCTEGKFLSK